MSFETYYTLESLIEAGRVKSRAKNVISFDLFDTLMVRRIHDPDLVKLPVARYISALAKARGLEVSWENVQALRDSIEQRQRAETGSRFDDHEACYPCFMTELLEQVFQQSCEPTLLDRVAGYELEMEKSMLVPRKLLVDWLAVLAASGKRVFIISDMYQPASFLRELVRHGGFHDSIEDVISSADTFLAKASGKAYAMIAEKYSIRPEEWLHVGDNAHSDGMRAAQAGIDALVIDDPREAQRKSIVKRYYNYSDGRPFWRGRLLQQLMAPMEEENSPQPSLYCEGYNFIGPLIGIFIQQLAQLCLQNNITKIFFLSREGWTFKRYWERTVPILYPAGGLPPTEYLYVSRMALAGAACAFQGLTKTNAAIAFLPSGNRDFRDLCRIFSLDAEGFTSHLKNYGLTADTCLSHNHDGFVPESRKQFDRMLDDPNFQEVVKQQTRPANQAMQRYFEEVGLFAHKRVAIVDIGWLGTIQRFLFEAIAHRDDCPKCFGYLFGATRGIPYPTSDNNTITGILYDRDRFDLATSTMFYARDIFEEACRAPHPTLNGYMLKGDGYKLEFRHTDDDIGQAEIHQDRYFSPLQQGIIDSAERFGAAAALLNYSLEDWKGWINYLLVNKLAFPRTREVVRIRHQHHLDDFHGQKKPKAEFSKGFKPLWERSLLQLRCMPFLRARCFLHHLRERINE
ncbi:MAG: HAD-IA family hydrolase [Desulforhopalus sp.]